MILGFESLRAKINQASGEKCKNVILATYNKHIILLMLFVYFYSQYTVIMSMSKYAVIFIILYILVMLYLIFLLLTNRVGIGMNDDRIIYVKFSRIGFKSKQVYCIDMDKIKYLDVRKILGNTNVKMSFIDGNGHLVKVNFRYTNKVFGLSSSEQKNNGKAIIDKLTELQRILDRGDF